MFQLSDRTIDAAALRKALEHSGAGAVVEFEGRVRDHNEGLTVGALEYEAYAALALREGERIVAEALERFEITAAGCVHRTGRLAIGECAVWVGVSAAHRGPAFEACRFIIDEVKTRVPIWKKEHYAAGASGWINAPAATEAG